jgi:hypothetical protein
MLTTELRENLLQEVRLAPQETAESSQFASSPTPQPKYVMAIVEMGRFEDERRLSTTRRLRQYATPLLQYPKYATFAPFGAMLLAHPEHPESPEALFEHLNFCAYDNDDTCLVWITATQPPKQLAAHLARFTFAEDDKGERYVLRYHSPRITPILQRFAPADWRADFFAPIFSWWYSVATPQGETWQRIAGGAQEGERQTLSTQPVTLLLNEELQDALINDSLPHHILQAMAPEELPETLSDTDCYGVRLARVEETVNEAQQKGLRQEEDLIAYTLSVLYYPALQTDANWQNAVQNAAQEKAPLDVWQPQD